MHAVASSRLSVTQTRSEHDRIRRAALQLCPTHKKFPEDARSELDTIAVEQVYINFTSAHKGNTSPRVHFLIVSYNSY